jgi:hypothetical protein
LIRHADPPDVSGPGWEAVLANLDKILAVGG